MFPTWLYHYVMIKYHLIRDIFELFVSCARSWILCSHVPRWLTSLRWHDYGNCLVAGGWRVGQLRTYAARIVMWYTPVNGVVVCRLSFISATPTFQQTIICWSLWRRTRKVSVFVDSSCVWLPCDYIGLWLLLTVRLHLWESYAVMYILRWLLVIYQEYGLFFCTDNRVSWWQFRFLW